MEAQKVDVTTEDSSPDSSELENSGIDSEQPHELPQGAGSQASAGGKLAGLFPDLNTVDWYLDPRFQRYWKHYHQVMNWYQKHIETYQMLTSRLNPGASNQSQSSKATANRFNPYAAFHRSTLSQRPRCQPSDAYSTWTPPTTQSHQGSTKIQKQANQRTYDNTETPPNVDSGGASGENLEPKLDAEINPEEFEMEITDEMVEFFAQSRKHKKERDDAKKSDGENAEDVYVDAEKVNRKKTATTQPPKERPGLRRTQEMKMLYGKGAAMIHGMETAMQMTFDRNTDLLQPKVWPNMPLKIVFS